MGSFLFLINLFLFPGLPLQTKAGEAGMVRMEKFSYIWNISGLCYTMHEWSIAERVIEVSRRELRKAGAEKVTEVELEIGEISGVLSDALEMAFLMAAKGTELEQTRLRIRRIPARARCRDCGKEFPVKQFFDSCPECGGLSPFIVNGRELNIASLSVEYGSEH